jgi:hypothetical protein
MSPPRRYCALKVSSVSSLLAFRRRPSSRPPSALFTIAITFAAFIEDGCAAASSDEHPQSIEVLRRFATITNSKEVVFSAP